ncbi:MAG: hypothetical protein GY940_36960 [bacterium]|nr:hypothetical protein [bacterium]
MKRKHEIKHKINNENKHRVMVLTLVMVMVLLAPTWADTGNRNPNGHGNGKGNVTVTAAVPEAGIKAEQQEKWETAVEIYRGVLSEQPGRVDLWRRIADIEAHLKHYEKAAEALKQESQLTPHNREVFFQLSRACAQADQPVKGLAAVERAVKLDRDNIQYLKARAQLANWVGKSKVAADSYYRLIKLLPEDAEMKLNLARADSWSGKLDRSAANYKKYLSGEWRQGNLEVLTEYIKVQTWRGNYASALELVEQYKRKGGDPAVYQRRKADILCRADRPRAGLKELEPLLQRDPDDYEMNTTRTIGYHYDHRPVEASGSLETLVRLRPHSKENRDMRKFVLTPQRHALPMGTRYYSDSIDISIFSAYLDAGVQLSDRVRVKGGYTRDLLKAPVQSAFNNINGEESVLHYKQWAGAEMRLSRGIQLDGYVATEKTDQLSASFSYAVNTRFRLSDGVHLSLGRRLGYFLISPRAVSLEVKMTVNQLDFRWEPSLKHTIALHAQYSTLSDNNTLWQLIAAPRYSVARTMRLNLDVGIKGWWFGYERSPGNGYWAPRFFQSYMGTANGYLKLSGNNGVTFRAEAGLLKSSNMDRFYFGYRLDAEGIFGVYRSLMLKLRAAYLHNSTRGNTIFSAYLLTASLVMRL